MDILSLGLDVSSFDAKKMAILNEYIALFEKLEKYDGKKFQPILGEGLTSFNASLKETNALLLQLNSGLTNISTSKKTFIQEEGQATSASKLSSAANKELISDYAILKKSLQDQAANYANLRIAKGKDAEATKAALAEYKATAGVLGSIDKNLGVGFSNPLTKGLSTLRTIAYILPGIGLAGIFNLAFEAIEKSVESLGFFNDKELDLAKLNTETNKGLTEQINLYQELIKLRKDFTESFGSLKDVSGNIFGYKGDNLTVTKEKEAIDLLKARGIAQDVLFPKEIKNAEKRLTLAERQIGLNKKDLIPQEEKLNNLKRDAKKYLDDISQAEGEIKYLDDLISGGKEKSILGTGIASKTKSEDNNGNVFNTETLKAQREAAKSKVELDKASFKELNDKLKEYYDAKQALEKTNQEYDKFNSDQARKKLVEETKENLSVKLDEEKKIIADDKTTHQERLNAIKREEADNIALAEINRINVTGTEKNPNLSSTEKEKRTARNKERDDVLKAKIDANQKIERENVKFYQDNLKAKTEIDKNELEQEAIKQEKISANLNNELDTRLQAYTKYILLKQRIQELEFEKDFQAGQSTPFGKGSLTPIQRDALRSDRDTQQSNIQANAQKQVYDIVYSSLQKELKAVVEFNKLEENENSRAYADSLRSLNDLYERHIISYGKYKRRRKKIDEGYRVKGLDIDIKNDIESIERLQTEKDKLLERQVQDKKKVSETSDNLEQANKSGFGILQAQRESDAAIGDAEATAQAIDDIDLKLRDAREKRDKDELSREKKNYEKKIISLLFFAEIEKKVYEAIKQQGDQQYEQQIARIEAYNNAIQEQYDKEINAIEKSSLTEKDKTALSIQLTEQKSEAEKNAILEEKRLKREQAEFDKKLSLAHIAISTVEAVLEALAQDGTIEGEIRAAERGALGAVEYALAAATQIPSYANETPEGGHPGGLARFGEIPEIVKEPYKSPYLVLTETVSYLPKGTEVVHATDAPIFGEKSNDSWSQTRWLAGQIKKNNKEIKNIFRPVININTGFERYKRTILGR